MANEGQYDNVVFHRVIDGFMAQTGDVKFGNSSNNDFDLNRAGMGGSDLPDLKAEFNSLPHEKGTVSMARSSDPDIANSQFFQPFQLRVSLQMMILVHSFFYSRQYPVIRN